MTESLKEQFAKNKWVYVEDVVSKERCAELTEALREQVKNGGTHKDTQCPMSESIYGFPPFEKLLEELTPVISNATGIELLPTYSFSRLYVPGEELAFHLDREACEISATLTLGHDKGSKNWPIGFCSKRDRSDEVYKTIDIGSLVAYRGTEMFHWRDVYKGRWHAQVFLHYVDANGKYANEALDRRQKLNNE